MIKEFLRNPFPPPLVSSSRLLETDMKSKQQPVELGDLVKDKITGLQGLVTGRTDWLYGCVRFVIQPTALKDGAVQDASTFDEPQLIILKKGFLSNKVDRATTPRRHGPRNDKAAQRR